MAAIAALRISQGFNPEMHLQQQQMEKLAGLAQLYHVKLVLEMRLMTYLALLAIATVVVTGQLASDLDDDDDIPDPNDVADAANAEFGTVPGNSTKNDGRAKNVAGIPTESTNEKMSGAISDSISNEVVETEIGSYTDDLASEASDRMDDSTSEPTASSASTPVTSGIVLASVAVIAIINLFI
ncbi:unnamed protein product [Peronospora belbahrii]|uniref:Uncharacterized protein n=1 Tax=Peronospora belbahrii TaxID=622444 RepID=A0AAU9KN59_9STRA|nr:unnamed protein product [Peronospora belbahrii]CAH0515664.1 unnamed protein product [Peronospora belbahrii]